jgi:hypothetical protein
MSLKIIKRHKLFYDVRQPGKIRLTWDMQAAGEARPKTTSTLFHVIDDDKIKHDVAIGTGWDNESDHDEDEAVDEEDDDDDQLEVRDGSDDYIDNKSDLKGLEQAWTMLSTFRKAGFSRARLIIWVDSA